MKLRVGLVGIGSAWESRHLPALRALSDRFEVRAVCDPVRHRAEKVARQLGAEPHDGFRTLIERSDVDAVLLLTAQWFGPLPIKAACNAGKAVYCSAALDLSVEQASELRQRLREAGVAFMAEFPCRLSPATLRLKELIATKLGPPRMLFCNRARAEAAEGRSSWGLRDVVELVDWCRYVIDREPTSLIASAHVARAAELESESNGQDTGMDHVSLQLDFSASGSIGHGPAATIDCGQYTAERWSESLAYRRPADMKVVCERGIAFVDLPSTVAWFDDVGQHMETLEHERPVGEQLLLHFHRAVESLVLQTSSLDDAHRAIVIANKTVESCERGVRVAC
ncbi:Gfo/Idh/MocA family oxidoreductase [Pirellulales bacterium]|nr:Gfo/Idh/MocA family oxidoreductase [Pirellulales bacterium]